jgi:membrane-bound lytic murein transglycosylase D
MDTKKIVLVSVNAVAFTALVFTAAYFYVKSERNSRQVPIVITENERRIYSPPIPDTMAFCSERVPLQDFDVHERIDREFLVNTYWHSAMLLYIKRANRWFSVIEPILKRNNIPDDFKYMAVAESGLSNTISTEGATGFWQLMEPAAKKYGLEINSEIDERYNVTKATQAACDYIKEAYSKFKSWTLAAASYNNGLNGIENQIERQHAKDYYNLFLNEETYRFIARIVTIKEIMKNPHRYGFYFSSNDLYPDFKTYDVKINYQVRDFAEFAREHGVNYKMLKIFNPWLRDNFLKNRLKKTYFIELPKPGEGVTGAE